MGQPPELLGILVQQGAQGTAWNTAPLVPRDHPLTFPLETKERGGDLGTKNGSFRNELWGEDALLLGLSSCLCFLISPQGS